MIEGTMMGYPTKHLIGMGVVGMFGLIAIAHAWKATRTGSFQSNRFTYTRDANPGTFRFMVASTFIIGIAALLALTAFLLHRI